MTAESRIRELLVRHFNESPSSEERAELLQLLSEHGNDPHIKDQLEKVWQSLHDSEQIISVPQQQALLDHVFTHQSPGNTIDSRPDRAIPHFSAWIRYAAAAIILLIAGSYIWFGRQSTPAVPAVTAAKTQETDIPPGGAKAMLTLADGSTIVLDNASVGALARQGAARIMKIDAGALAYTAQTAKGSGKETVYNKISTPRGGQYQVVLADGTRVWLNAASSVKFPTVFTGNARSVEITGEAYLEVAPDKSKPFHVIAAGADIRVLGTSFNINAYNDESVLKATLITGSIQVLHDHFNATLKPGQQAGIGASGNKVSYVNTDPVIAWKNGVFNFKDADLPAVMRQLERWYDINVVYKGKIPVREFQGELPQDLSLSQMLRILTEMEVGFSLKGRTLTILN